MKKGIDTQVHTQWSAVAENGLFCGPEEKVRHCEKIKKGYPHNHGESKKIEIQIEGYK